MRCKCGANEVRGSSPGNRGRTVRESQGIQVGPSLLHLVEASHGPSQRQLAAPPTIGLAAALPAGFQIPRRGGDRGVGDGGRQAARRWRRWGHGGGEALARGAAVLAAAAGGDTSVAMPAAYTTNATATCAAPFSLRLGAASSSLVDRHLTSV